MKNFLSITILIGVITLTGCHPKPKKPKDVYKPDLKTFKEDMIGEIIPILNGGAYANSFSKGIWYFYNAEVMRVKYFTEQSSPDKTAFEEASMFEITPITSGGAYATSMRDGTWYLYEAIAYPVKEVSSISIPAKSSSVDSAFILYLAERCKRKAAESSLENTSANNSESLSEPQESDFYR